MNLAEFKDLAQAIQSIAVAVAVLTGGIWAVYRFWLLGELKKARAELDRLGKTLVERGTLNVTVAARSVERTGDNGHYIQVDVSISNVGNRSEALDWSEGRVHTARVVGEAKGTVTFGKWIETSLVGWQGRRISSSLAPAESSVYPFLVPVDKPGLYYVAIVVPGSAQEREVAEKYHEGVSAKPGLIRWAAETYVNVRGAQGSGNVSAT